MKKVLFVIGTWLIGGTERSVKSIIESLSDEWERELLIFRKIRWAKREKGLSKFPFPEGIRVSRIEKSNEFSLFFALLKFLRTIQPDIISSHLCPTYNEFFLLLLARKFAYLKAPVIVTNHGDYYFPKKTPIDQIMYFPKRYILKKCPDFFVGYCKYAENIMKRVWRIPPAKLTTIYNPIVSEKLWESVQDEPLEYRKFCKCPRLVCVSRLDIESKDFLTLLRAFRFLKEKHPDVKLFIIGEGKDKDIIIRWINELKLKEDVFLLGVRVNPYPYIYYADVLVHPNVSEGPARVIVEALGLGCPVVATGSSELKGIYQCGIFVPIGDPVKLAEGLSLVLEYEELRKRIVENGKEIAKEFSFSVSARKREELFYRLVNG